MNDVVNHPEHYQGKVECIDCLEAATEGLTGIEAVCTANAIKYLYRWKKKNGVEDLKKARWYIDRLISNLEPAAVAEKDEHEELDLMKSIDEVCDGLQEAAAARVVVAHSKDEWEALFNDLKSLAEAFGSQKED